MHGKQQGGDPQLPTTQVASIAGYRDIASVTGSNRGQTVTVVFGTPFADWKMLFGDLVPAHVMEKAGWNPACTTVNPAIDLSGGPFKISAVKAQSVTLVQNPRWWGTPSNSRSITIHLAGSTAELAQWMSSGYVQVAEATTPTPQFLAEMTGLPAAQSEVDTSATLLQLDMSSTPASTLPSDLRTAIALSINRQDLVGQQASWAGSGLAVADSHVNVQGQPGYKPTSSPTSTTTVPPPTSATSTTTVGSGGTVNFPVTDVPDEAAGLIAASGLVRSPGSPYYQVFGAPFELHLAYDTTDPWAMAAAPAIRDDLDDAGLETTLIPESGATPTGEALAAGTADLALLPVTFTPYMSQILAWYTSLLGPAGKNGSQNWTGYSNSQFDAIVKKASQQFNANTEAGYFNQADVQLWQDMVSLPLYAEPTALAWSDKIGGVTAAPRSNDLLWYAQFWAVRVPESTSDTTPSLPGQ